MVFMNIFLYEKSCDRLCLLDFNEWNCIIIFLYGTIKLIIIIFTIIIIITITIITIIIITIIIINININIIIF